MLSQSRPASTALAWNRLGYFLVDRIQSVTPVVIHFGNPLQHLNDHVNAGNKTLASSLKLPLRRRKLMHMQRQTLRAEHRPTSLVFFRLHLQRRCMHDHRTGSSRTTAHATVTEFLSLGALDEVLILSES